MTVRFSSILGATPRAELEATLSGGEWLLGPLYLALGEDSLALDAAFRIPPARGLELERLRVIEPGVFTLEGDLRWRPDRVWPDGGFRCASKTPSLSSLAASSVSCPWPVSRVSRARGRPRSACAWSEEASPSSASKRMPSACGTRRGDGRLRISEAPSSSRRHRGCRRANSAAARRLFRDRGGAMARAPEERFTQPDPERSLAFGDARRSRHPRGGSDRVRPR